MVPLSTEGQAALASGLYAVRTLIDAYPDEGAVRFWDDFTQLTYDGPKSGETDETYNPMGELVTIEALRSGPALSSNGVKITVDANMLSDPSSLLTELESATWHQREIWIREVILDISRGDAHVIGVVPVFAGLMDVMDRDDSDNNKLVIQAESGARWFTRRTMRTRSDADQQELYSGDKFFEYTPTAGVVEIAWGRGPERAGGGGGSSRGGVNSDARLR
jgi:hypothetical protein